MSDTETNREIITRIFAETAKGNGKPYVEALAENATFRTIGSNSWSKTFRGREEILTELFGRLSPRLEGRNTCTPTRILADGDFVIVQAVGKNKLKNGGDYNNDYCFVIRMEAAKMAAIEEYCDTQLVASALGERLTQ